jgi:hypothetical protein
MRAGVKRESVMPKVRQVQDQVLEPLPVELRPVFQHYMRLGSTANSRLRRDGRRRE